MRASATLAFRVESRAGGGARLRRSLGRVFAAINSSSTPGGPPALDDAVVVRVASGHRVLHGPVQPGLRRFLRKAIEADLAAMTESEFLRAWGPPGGWQQRYDRWRERGWRPPVQ